ncbi:serine/threonine protein kinase [Pedobacter frigidisoli]|uniref:Serine/threonine protein kinase n=1 Tax=Pedobacter frigidisoli TaxID=2530455 RepID=A0A4R0P5Y8_9SPHI|nr:serine/threonine-protein kinase [Pedobacter frigidisoli]TCD10826.1 serine/threonine protein kinase [Pedobacter frigidisoli]
MSEIFTITEGLQNLGALKTGGQGSVYKGMRMGPIYSAIKLIPTPIYVEDDSDKNYRNFLNEVTKLQQVNIHPSPNVVKILSSGITDSGSFPYIEMEYIEGPELGELLLPPHQKVFTVKELLKVAEQLAAALAHCHQVDVKHGDVKSNNVKYNIQTANYVLLDFGLAIMSEEQRRTSIRHAGAIEFMAPEQHEGKMLLQTDIYSYGIILYELLAGQVPFPLEGNGDTGRNSVMIGHLEKEIPDAMALRKNNLANAVQDEVLISEMQVPHWLLKLIERCLQKDPAERFANGMELYKAVTNGLISSAPLNFQSTESTFPNESLNFEALKGEARQKTEKLENELAILKPLAFKAGIKYNEASGKYQQEDYLNIPRKVFLGCAAACLILIAFLSYNFFKTPNTVVTTAQTTPYESPFITYNKQYQQRLVKAREDSIRTAKMLSPEQVKIAEKARKQNGKQKKKKKFLGIF